MRRTIQMEAMEPRMLLSADALALAGLPGMDAGKDDAPWDLSSSGPEDLDSRISSEATGLPDAPLLLDLFATPGDAGSVPHADDLLPHISADNPSATPTQVLFVDANTPDYLDLVSGVGVDGQDKGFIVYLIDTKQDGVAQITQILAQHENLTAIHIIAHGAAGELLLGDAVLSNRTLDDYASDITSWSVALSDEADILIYGCNFAAHPDGLALTNELARLTGADVAASVDDTGHAQRGGDWDLEYATGSIETDVAINAEAQHDWSGLLAGGLTTTGEFTVNDPSANAEQTSGPARGAERAVDIAANGDYVVVWSDATSNDKVLAKMFDKDGNEKVPQFQVNTGGGNNQWADVAVDDSGNFVATWTASNDIYMRRFTASGAAVDAVDVRVNTTTSNVQQNPSVNMNGAGDFVIAWEGNGGANEGIFVRQGSVAGGLAGGDITVDTAAAAQDPSVGIADSGDFVVVWDDGSGDVFFQLFNSGGPQNSGQVDSGLQPNAGHAAVDMSGDGRFTVAYRTTVLGFGVFARQFDSAGTPLFAPQLVNTSIVGDQTNPSISMDDTGDFIVVWEGTGDQSGNVDADGVFGQKFDASGGKIGSEFRINETTANVQDCASVTMLNRDNFVVVWTGSDGSQDDVFARQYGDTSPPTLDLDANDSSGATGNDYRFTFTEGDGPTAIADSDTDLSDVDSTTFDHVTLSISGLLDGNAEVLVFDGDTFALATAVAGQDTSGGNYHVVMTTGAGTATASISKQGGGTFNETETETLIKAMQYQHTDVSAPTDGNRLIDVTVNDGTTDSAAARTTIDVNPMNDAPVITSDGGGATASVNAQENQTSVTTVSASDADVPADTLTFSIAGGADAALFSINSTTGVLTFNTAPDFETPTDFDTNGVYEVTVQVDDGNGGVDTQVISVTVTDVSEGSPTPPPPAPLPLDPDPTADGQPDPAADPEPSPGGNGAPGTVIGVVDGLPGYSSGGSHGATANVPGEGLADADGEALVELLQALNSRDSVDLLWQSFEQTALVGEIRSLMATPGFLNDLDRVRAAFDQATVAEKLYVASTIAVSTGLSIGYVVWLIRSGVLLSTVLSSLPVWQFVDPLPILATPAKKKRKQRKKDREGDSLESMFKDQPAPADSRETKTGLRPKARESRWPWRS